MVNLLEFNLVYTRNEDGRKFLCKLVTKMDRVLIDTIDGSITRITEAKMRTRYTPMKELNRINKKNPFFMNFGSKRIN